MHVSPRIQNIQRFEHAVEKLSQVFEKVDFTTKLADAKPEVRKHIEAGKPKTRASKLEYKLVDEVYVSCFMVTIVLTSPVKLGCRCIQVQARGFDRGARNGDGPR